MRRAYDRFVRPLLDVGRADTVTACLVEGLETWDDPHNQDPAYTRVRVRRTVLPMLEEQLGPGVAATLARTADQLRSDMDLLDDLAEAAYADLRAADGALPVAELAQRPAPVRRRVLRLAALDAGAPASELFYEHVLAMDALLTDWHGQRWVDLPGPVRCTRADGSAAGRTGPLTRLSTMDAADVPDDLVNVLFTEEQIQGRLRELAAEIEADYAGKDLLIVGILRGAVMVMADLARSFSRHLEMDWMAVSSYGSGTKSSGVVRILKDLDTDISGRHVVIVDEIIDTGLTLSWLTSNLTSRSPASVEICTLLRKPEALTMQVDVKYVGWDIPNEFVVGYGLDYRERYRNLRDIGTLAPHVYS